MIDQAIVEVLTAKMSISLGRFHVGNAEIISQDGHIKLADFGLAKKLECQEVRTYKASITKKKALSRSIVFESNPA